MEATRRVLIVDDEPMILELLEKLFDKEPGEFAITTASSGEQALRACRASIFDLVVSDIVMPNMDGLELIRALKSEQPETRIIAMTGAGPSRGETYLRCAELFGATTSIEKPFSARALNEAVTTALSA